MKKIAILSLFCLTLVTLASAQSADEKDVAAAIERLTKAMLDADKNALEDLTGKELSYGHSSGTMEDKATFVDVIASGKNDYVVLELSDQTITMAGSIAIVRHKFVAEMSTKTKTNLGVLQIWQKQQKKWKLIARQAFKL